LSTTVRIAGQVVIRASVGKDGEGRTGQGRLAAGRHAEGRFSGRRHAGGPFSGRRHAGGPFSGRRHAGPVQEVKRGAMFRIKICGMTNIDDALAAVRAGADAVGLNFYARSPRFVDVEVARQIAAALPAGVAKVGLFVNAPQQHVCETFDQLGLDLVQLHGDEPPEYLAGLGGRPVMRAFRLGAAGVQPVVAYLEQCRRLHNLPQMTLIDSYVAGRFGGTGQPADWVVLQQYPAESWHPPLVLAGGLTPENVAAAIHLVRPAAVDVASGVETAPGRKDPAAVEAFVQAASAALAAVSASIPPMV